MADSKAITIDNPTKKALVVGIAALCLCAIGALLVVGRGSGGTSLDAVARAAGGLAPPATAGGTTQGVGGTPRGTQDGLGRSGGTRGGGGTSQSFDDFRQCLREQGVALPDPGPRQGMRPELSDSLRRAFETCRRYLPTRPSGGPGLGGSGSGDGFAPPFGAPPSDGQGTPGGSGQGSDDSTF